MWLRYDSRCKVNRDVYDVIEDLKRAGFVPREAQKSNLGKCQVFCILAVQATAGNGAFSV